MGTVAFCHLLDIPGKVKLKDAREVGVEPGAVSAMETAVTCEEDAGVEYAVKIGVDIELTSTVVVTMDILVEAVVDRAVDSTVVVVETDDEIIAEVSVEIPAGHRGDATASEGTTSSLKNMIIKFFFNTGFY